MDAWIDALVADPGCEAALEALRRHGVTTRDHAPLVEALVRVGEAKTPGAEAERVSCLQALLVLAEERLGDPGLAAWATRRLGVLVQETDELRATALRLAPRVSLQDEVLAQARTDLLTATGPLRTVPLARLTAILAGRPDAADAYLDALRELLELEPEERSHGVAAERVLTRLGRHAELDVLLGRLASKAPSGVERARARLALATLRRRNGAADGALQELMPLVADTGAHAAADSLALLLAAQRGDKKIRALALAKITSQLPPSLRAVLLAVAAEEQLAVGDAEGARVVAELACNADPSLARPAAARARVGAVLGGRAGAESIERAMSIRRAAPGPIERAGGDPRLTRRAAFGGGVGAACRRVASG